MASASSSSHTTRISGHPSTIRKLTDDVYEVHRPARGYPQLEMVFFHGFQKENHDDAYLQTWMTADESTCWLLTWLPEAFPQSRILSISYDSSVRTSATEGRMDMHLLGENLAVSLIELAKVGQSCPVLLVGHCVGGLVLKQVCIQAHRKGSFFKDPGINPYSTFLTYMRGVFFYATPHLGSQVVDRVKREGPLLEYLQVYHKETSRINDEFSKLGQLHRWTSTGISEGSETRDDCNVIVSASQSSTTSKAGRKRKHSSMLIVEEAAARFHSEEFAILAGEDHFTICKPKTKKSSSFLWLVSAVEKILQREETGKEIFRRLVGCPEVFVDMRHRVDEVIHQLCLEQAEPSKFALVGTSGIGKTTLAKQVFVSIMKQFDYVCFIEDVSEKLKYKELPELLAEGLFHGTGAEAYVQGSGKHSIWHLLRGKRVLITIDGVEGMEQIKSLLDSNWCAKGSRLLITTYMQNEELKSHFYIHEVMWLDSEESKELFLAHVTSDVITMIPEDLIDAIVEKCDGLPLTLVVTSRYLRRTKKESVWKGALAKLQKAQSVDGSRERLWSKLRLAVDALDETERVIFLDLTIFDDHEDNVTVLGAAWESTFSPGEVEISLRNLVERSLVLWVPKHNKPLQVGAATEWNPDSKSFVAKVRKQLRDMGRSILRPANERLELCKGIWQPADINQLLKSTENNFQTQLLSVCSTDQVIDWSCLARMDKLRLLQMKNASLRGNDNSRLPSQLTLLHMINCSREPYSWLWNQVNKFMESRSWPVREQDVEGLRKLTVLLLDNCRSVKLPNNFHCLKNLRILWIHVEGMTQLPESFGLLPALQTLSLCCPNLKQLPASFLQLPELTHLEIKECSALKAWPSLDPRVSSELPAFRPLINLTSLQLVGVSALSELPDSFGQMKFLRNLKLESCHALKHLPEGFGDLQRLEVLTILQCDSLTHLCVSFGQLKSLAVLEIQACSRFWCLPESLSGLEEIALIRIDETNIRSVPESIGKLKNLQEFHLRGCRHIHSLPKSMEELSRLEEMIIGECESLESFFVPKQVLSLECRECHSIQSFTDSFEKLERVGHLTISGLKNLRSLPDNVVQIKGLNSLCIENCRQLETLPKWIEKLGALENLTIRGCPNLKALPALEQLGTLQSLTLGECSPPANLSMVIKNHPMLGWLELSCSQRVPECLEQLKCPLSLNITDSEAEILSDSIENFQSLESLNISECDNLRTLPTSIGQLRDLGELEISGCPRLKSLPDSIGNLHLLTHLTINRCDSLKTLPESFGHLQSLAQFYVEECNSLETLPSSFALLKALRVLQNEGHVIMEHLPDSVDELRDCKIFVIRCRLLTSEYLDSLPYGVLRET